MFLCKFQVFCQKTYFCGYRILPTYWSVILLHPREKMMKRRIACFFLMFAGLMLAVHGILPHHHHCHHVVFLQTCQERIHDWGTATGKSEEGKEVRTWMAESSCASLPIQGILTKSHCQGCPSDTPIPTSAQDDPCWKNSDYINKKSLQVDHNLSYVHSFVLLFKDRNVSLKDGSPWEFFKKKWEILSLDRIYKGIHPLASGLRAPPAA